MTVYVYSITLITSTTDGLPAIIEPTTVTVGATTDKEADSLAWRVIRQEQAKLMKYDNVTNVNTAGFNLLSRDGILIEDLIAQVESKR